MNSGTEVQMAFKPAWAEIEYTHYYTLLLHTLLAYKGILSQGEHSWTRRRINQSRTWVGQYRGGRKGIGKPHRLSHCEHRSTSLGSTTSDTSSTATAHRRERPLDLLTVDEDTPLAKEDQA